MLTIGLTHYLVLAAVLFCCGLFVMTTKRNAIGILIGAELVLNAAGLNFVAFSRYRTGLIDGQIATLFVIVLAAAEAAIAIAIFVNYYREIGRAHV
jgi:NADH-quinone oxidoreductase subunit K